MATMAKKRRRPWGSSDALKMSSCTLLVITGLVTSSLFCIPFAAASPSFHENQRVTSSLFVGHGDSNAIRHHSQQQRILLDGGDDEASGWRILEDPDLQGDSRLLQLDAFDGFISAQGSTSTPAQEEDVTPTPSFLAATMPVSEPVSVASMPPYSLVVDHTNSPVAPYTLVVDHTNSPVPPPTPSSPPAMQVTTRAPFEIPLNFNVVLRIPKGNDSIDPTDLLRDTEHALEDYLIDGLKKIETEVVKLKSVSLIATFWGLSRKLRGVGSVGLQRRILQDDMQELNLEVTGAVEFEIEQQDGGVQDPGSLNQLENSLSDKVENELNVLLKDENLDRIGQEVVTEAFGVVGEDRDQTNPDNDNGGDDGNGNTPLIDTQVGKNTGSEEDLEQPSLLSIIFGFALLGLATAGLCAYGYIFYKKRMKRLRKRKQMKESIQYKLPTTSSTANSNNSKKCSVAPTSAGKASSKTPDKGEDADSEGSSYNGLGTDSTSVPGDSFARELQLAASLDQQAWDDFQRKKQRSKDAQDGGTLSASPSADEEAYVAAATSAGLTVHNPRSPSTPPDSRAANSIAESELSRRDRSDVNAPASSSSSSRWPRSFPYGDEDLADDRVGRAASHSPYDDDFPDDEGVEWVASQDDDEDWDERIGTSRESSGKNTSSFLASSRAMIDRIGRNFEIYGTSNVSDDEMEDSNADNSRNIPSLLTSDIVQEVERLSKFVKRYEMKKERRMKRQHDVHQKFDHHGAVDVSYDEVSGSSHRSPYDGRSFDTSRGVENNAHYQNRALWTPSPSSAPLVSNNLRTNLISDAEARYGGRGNDERSPANQPQMDSDPPDLVPDPSLNHDATLSASDSESEVSDRRQFGQQRLGITPFSVEKPNGAHHISYQQENTRSHFEMPDKMTRQGALASLRGQDAVLDNRNTQGHGRSRHSTGGRLSALRANDAILDASQSEVGVSYPVPIERNNDKKMPRGGVPRRHNSLPSSRPMHAKKFNNIRAMFERSADRQDAIFPPDQHWQFASFAAKG